MAYISKIQIENGVYDIKDETTRNHTQFTFNNIASLKSSTILEIGNYVKTMGYYNIDDGGNGLYYVRQKTNNDTTNDRDIIQLSNNNLVAEYINDKKINPLVFGAKGDGTTDDTIALQFTLDYANNKELEVFIPTPTNFYKITSGLTVKSNIPGIICEKYDYDGIIRGYDSNYTMITINPNLGFYCKNLTIGGNNRNSINGILFQGHIGLNIFEHIRIYNLSGYGFKINAIWDSILTDISIEKCGNSTEYAFSMNDDGDTCNMTNINRLQIEEAYEKAIYIDSGTFNCTFNNIHSERLNYTNDNNYAWIFDGGNNEYLNVKLDANNNSGDIKNLVNIKGNNTKFNGLRIDSNLNITYESTNNLTITNAKIYSATEVTDQVGNVIINDSTISIINCKVNTTINNSNITNYYAGGNYASDGKKSKIFNSIITVLNQNDNHCNIYAENCVINKLVTDEVLVGEIRKCTINGLIKKDGTSHDKIAYSHYNFYDNIINSDIGLDGSYVIMENNTINGNFYWQYGTSSNWYSLINNKITGSVTGFNTAPTQSPPKLTKTDNLQPTSSSAKGWIYDGNTWLAY